MRITHVILCGIILCAFTLINLYISFGGGTTASLDCAHCGGVRSRSSEADPTIYFVTPTYARHVQKAELTRISHTLLLANDIHWIVIEDAQNRTTLVGNVLRETFLRAKRSNSRFSFTHLNVATPVRFKTRDTDPNWLKPRGVWQRNEGLRWLRANRNSINRHGVVYFGDDDNTYDLRLFDEIRTTSIVSVFPVALVGGLLVERPIVQNRKVIGFNSAWQPNRQYPLDMAGFAINLRLLLDKPDAAFSEDVARGYQETHLLKQLIGSIDELEPKANFCRRTLVWHTRTQLPKLRQEKKLKIPSNFAMLDD